MFNKNFKSGIFSIICIDYSKQCNLNACMCVQNTETEEERKEKREIKNEQYIYKKLKINFRK